MAAPSETGDMVPERTTSSKPVSGAAPSVDRYMPVLAIGAMIATFVALNPYLAIILIATIWLVGTRLRRRRRLLGLTLTEALAWTATIQVAEFVAIIVLFALGGSPRT